MCQVGKARHTPTTLKSGFPGLRAPDFNSTCPVEFIQQLQQLAFDMVDTVNSYNTDTGLTSTQDMPQVSTFVNNWANLGMWWFSIALMFVCLIIMWLSCCLKRKHARPPIYKPIIVLNPNNDGIHRLDGLNTCSFSFAV
ncbi:E3 CR1-beta0 [Human mastadenovirus C]|uniref:E3 CR1-beta0 n=2 Tax=Human mastadenovirus C TaxID=129951 RepID=A0A3Q9HKE5_9ADEN|nr:E3 CR1-beta0 [Human mastadenovirus C]AZR66838.1 E3 CR1-beta0 [Human mastadenovirus C]UXO93670.1 E3 CR1-beta0 [Human adenovirus 1]